MIICIHSEMNFELWKWVWVTCLVGYDNNGIVIYDATLLGQLFYAKLLKPDTEGMKKEKHQRNIHQQLEENPYDVYDDSEGMVIGMIG